ncbi:MAG TPA: DUF6057 family protein, partial [Anaerovoracaceae bacterium]|nr:DUF6057 family protein [Anaerovoracaceae bacterium]
DYFRSYFNHPAWLTSYAGDFLTQFFYLRGGGPIVLALLFCMEWLLASFVIKRITLSKNAPLWALLPVAIDWILSCDLLHPVSVTIGFIAVLLLFLCYASISNRRLALATGLAFILIGYWIAGSLFLLFPVLVICLELKSKRKSWAIWILVAIFTFLIPVVSRDYYLLTILQSYIYPAVKLQSLLLPVTLIVALMCVILLKQLEVRYQRYFSVALSFIFVAMMVVGIKANASFYYEKILSLDNEYNWGNNERVIELSRKYELKSRNATYYTNMALAKKGLLPEYLMEFYQPASFGLILPVSPEENWQTIFVSNEVFFLMGDMNLAQHSAMLGNTFSPYQRSSRMIKRLAEINLINGDSAAANKYLQILTHTRFHKKWAENRLAMNHASASNKWLTEKRAQIPITDTLRKSNDYLASLNFLVQQNPKNLVALDYLLCYYLLNKDLNALIKVYDQYGRLIKRPVTSLYSEALLIKLYSRQATKEEITSYSISPQIINDFVAYTQLYDQSKGDLNVLKERFGKSYWFYYHFATIQKK